jgi:hypothetical protein
MIKNLTGVCGLTVERGSPAFPYIPQNSSNPIQGMLRINNTDMEVFNGSTWQILNTSMATVSLDQDTQDLLQWARTQRQLERNRATLIENNPALEKAYKAILRAEQNFEILSKFVEEDEHRIVAGYNFNTP